MAAHRRRREVLSANCDSRTGAMSNGPRATQLPSGEWSLEETSDRSSTGHQVNSDRARR